MKSGAQEKIGREPAGTCAKVIPKVDACNAFHQAIESITSFAEILIVTGAEKAVRSDEVQLHIGVVLEALSRDARAVFEQNVGRC